MINDGLEFQRNSPQVSEDYQSSSESDSDDEVSKLQNICLEGFDTFNEPVTGTGFIYHDKMAEHKCEWDSGYPENPQRLIRPLHRCTELGLVQRCQRLQIRYATEDEIIWKHTRDHVELAQSTVGMTQEELMALCEKYDAWYANKTTYEASLIAAGSTISMVEHIIQDKLSNGFAMIRPPGHHAMEQEFNGYCTFNNVALAAQFALNSGIERILIVDWDVHHGQGTQRMFYDDPRVLYFSIHRYEHGRFWPNLRESDYDYIGKGKGAGFNINIPLNKTGMTDSDYMAAFNMVLLPVAHEFQPQLILISSGYDAAVGCPEGEMLVTPAMYAQMTHQLMGLAAGRVCVVLEGGYCLQSLAEGCALTLRSLLRDPCPKLPPLTEPSDSMMTTILNAIKVLRKYWECFKHYETLDGSEICHFAEVNEMPPVQDVTFSTPENKPEKYQIMNCYPVQEEKTRLYYSDLISKLIAETNLSVAEYRCCYVFDAEMRSHKNIHDKSHPERPERISKIYSTMAEWKLLHKCLTVASRLARKSELLLIHGEDYLSDLLVSQSKADDELKNFPNQHRYVSTYLHQKSVHCALLSCGSLLNVVEAVLRGKAQSGLAIVRPPGHHAESNKAMGFCFINNVAVAAKFAREHFGLKKILIVDWDVHHGNATQHQFYNDPSVLYVSLHRYDNGNYFPGSSDADLNNVGTGQGKGYNVNIPWSYAKMGDAEYMAAFTQIVMPIAYQFSPELVLVSAGFDCAVGDPLGGYNVTPACFGHMTHMLMGLANGRIVLALEGGYNLNSLSVSMATCAATLLGYPCPMQAKLAPNDSATETIRGVLEVQKKYWTCLKGSVRIPSVRKVDNERWVVVQENVNRNVRTRRAVASKSTPSHFARPSSAGSGAVPHRSVVGSASESSVTHTATNNTTTDETEPSTSLESSKDTTISSTQSTKDTGDTSQPSEEQSTNQTTPNPSSTADSSLLSASDQNRNAGIEYKQERTIQQIPEASSQELSCPHVPEMARGNVEEPAAVPENSTNFAELVSSTQNLTFTDSVSQASSHEQVENTVDLTMSQQSPSPASASVIATAGTDQISPPKSSASPKNISSPKDETQKQQDAIETHSGHSGLPIGSGDAAGAKPKQAQLREMPSPVFRSLIYGDEPDPEPLSIFADNPLMASQEQILIAKERGRDLTSSLTKTDTTAKVDKVLSEGIMADSDQDKPDARSHASTKGDVRDASSCAGDPESSRGGNEEHSDLLGACGGSSRPRTVQEFIRTQGVEEMHAVQPLTWCPHLTEVRPLPQSEFAPNAPCNTCGDSSENWICLTCYKVECSRFVNEHMLMHRLETDHNMVLSFSDLSVWCYGCDHYVHNDVLFPMINAAHEIKFGESLA